MTATNKIALVTGASRGLGKNMALSLASSGLDVVVTYHSKKDEAEQVVRHIRDLGRRASALPLDVCKIASFASFTEQLTEQLHAVWETEKIDFLINNAGFGIEAPIAQTTEAQFDELLGVHFKGVFFLTQKLLPLLNDHGGIVNLSTGLTRFAIPGLAAYASMKGAIETYTKYLAKELGPRGIRANVVAPGAIDTDFNRERLDQHPEMRNFISAQTALGRMGVADDIGGVVAFLCTGNARWVNAQRLEASGGMFL